MLAFTVEPLILVVLNFGVQVH